MIDRFIRRYRYWRQAGEREAQLREEMAAHLEMVRQELEAAGLAAADAAAEARRRFGATAYHAEDSRATWLSRSWTDLGCDLRYAFRTMRRTPGVTLAAVLSAGLGIGVSTGIFSVGNGLLSQPLRIEEPGRLVSISGRYLKSGSIGNSIALPERRALNEATRTMTGIAAYIPGVQGIFGSSGRQNDATRHWGSLVSANYFAVVRPPMVLGGGFTAGDDQIGRPPVVVLSHALWQAEFGGDPGLAGKTVELNGRAVTVAGVTAPGFRGTDPALVSTFWIPFSMLEEVRMLKPAMFEEWDARMLFCSGRLKPGVTLEQAASELEVIAARLRAQQPELMKGRSYHVEVGGRLFPAVRPVVQAIYFLLLATSVLVQLIACANVANLLLARAAARQKEMATRLAIGASRERLIRQLLTESLVLAAAGGTLGLALCALVLPAIGRLETPTPIPVDLGSTIDYRVVAFTAAVSLLTGLAFGLVPAWRAAGTGSVRTALAGDRFRLRDGLVVAQVAVAVVLLVGAGLALRSLQGAAQLDPGIGARNLLMIAVDPSLRRYTPAQTGRFFEEITRRIEAMPGVEAVSTTSRLPLGLIGISITAHDARQKGRDVREISAGIYTIGRGYFSTLRVPVLLGDEFRGAEKDVAILNQAAVRQMFNGENPIGLMIGGLDVPYRVVGVVADFKSSTIGEPPGPGIFLPRDRESGMSPAIFGTYLVIRTTDHPLGHLEAVRREIRRFDANLAVLDTRTWSHHLRQALLLPRLAAIIVGFCGVTGFLIAALGLYGVIRFNVERRRRELGIRLAMGARAADVVRLVLRHGAGLVALGLVIGLVLALAMGRAVQGALYGVRGTDGLTYAIVIPGVLIIALAACWLPARRAAALDPAVTLRCE